MSISRHLVFLPLPALLLVGCANVPNNLTKADSVTHQTIPHDVFKESDETKEQIRSESVQRQNMILTELSHAEQIAYKTSLINSYQTWAGTPYRYMGNSSDGIDCSAFVRQVYKGALGVHLPRTTLGQVKLGVAVDKENLQVGDLVFFKTGKNERHVGIYLNDNQFISATGSRGVAMSDLSHSYWVKNYWQARRPISNDEVIKDLENALNMRTQTINQNVEQIVVARIAQEKREKLQKEAQMRRDKAGKQSASHQEIFANKQGEAFHACSMKDHWIEYKVKSGDSLGKIAKHFSASVQKIKQDNHLKDDIIQIGQVLKVHFSDYPPQFEYTVKAGDTLSGIAHAFHTSVKEIKEINHLKSNVIQYKQELKLPC